RDSGRARQRMASLECIVPLDGSRYNAPFSRRRACRVGRQESMAAKKYDESSVKKLRGIEPVQRLPGMYTRTSDPTHIIQEAIENAADESFGGHADRVDVTL